MVRLKRHSEALKTAERYVQEYLESTYDIHDRGELSKKEQIHVGAVIRTAIQQLFQNHDLPTDPFEQVEEVARVMTKQVGGGLLNGALRDALVTRSQMVTFKQTVKKVDDGSYRSGVLRAIASIPVPTKIESRDRDLVTGERLPPPQIENPGLPPPDEHDGNTIHGTGKNFRRLRGKGDMTYAPSGVFRAVRDLGASAVRGVRDNFGGIISTTAIQGPAAGIEEAAKSAVGGVLQKAKQTFSALTKKAFSMLREIDPTGAAKLTEEMVERFINLLKGRKPYVQATEYITSGGTTQPTIDPEHVIHSWLMDEAYKWSTFYGSSRAKQVMHNGRLYHLGDEGSHFAVYDNKKVDGTTSVLIAVRGTKPGTLSFDLITDILMMVESAVANTGTRLLGRYLDMKPKVIDALGKFNNIDRIDVGGHSLGGAMSLALHNDLQGLYAGLVHTVAFDPFILASDDQHYNKPKIKIYTFEGEKASSPALSSDVFRESPNFILLSGSKTEKEQEENPRAFLSAPLGPHDTSLIIDTLYEYEDTRRLAASLFHDRTPASTDLPVIDSPDSEPLVVSDVEEDTLADPRNVTPALLPAPSPALPMIAPPMNVTPAIAPPMNATAAGNTTTQGSTQVTDTPPTSGNTTDTNVMQVPPTSGNMTQDPMQSPPDQIISTPVVNNPTMGTGDDTDGAPPGQLAPKKSDAETMVEYYKKVLNEVSTMKISELKLHLKAENLSRTGNKTTLKTRLKEAAELKLEEVVAQVEKEKAAASAAAVSAKEPVGAPAKKQLFPDPPKNPGTQADSADSADSTQADGTQADGTQADSADSRTSDGTQADGAAVTPVQPATTPVQPTTPVDPTAAALFPLTPGQTPVGTPPPAGTSPGATKVPTPAPAPAPVPTLKEAPDPLPEEGTRLTDPVTKKPIAYLDTAMDRGGGEKLSASPLRDVSVDPALRGPVQMLFTAYGLSAVEYCTRAGETDLQNRLDEVHGDQALGSIPRYISLAQDIFTVYGALWGMADGFDASRYEDPKRICMFLSCFVSRYRDLGTPAALPTGGDPAAALKSGKGIVIAARPGATDASIGSIRNLLKKATGSGRARAERLPARTRPTRSVQLDLNLVGRGNLEPYAVPVNRTIQKAYEFSF